MEKISVIVPCLNEEEAVPLFYREICMVFKQMPVYCFEFIFVDDGSHDETLTVIKSLSENDENVKYISFSRNFGKDAAMYAGLKASSGDYAVIMDADLQDPPRLLPEMMEMLKNERLDYVAARRVSRKGEPAIRSFFAKRFYRLMKKIAKTDLADGARDFRLMTRQFVGAVLRLCEYNRFTKGLFGWVGFKTKWLEYENVNRSAGKTKFSFWKLLIYAIDGIVAFSAIPLAFTTLAGLFFCLLAFAFIIFIIIRTVLFGDPVAGWPSMICVILLVSGVQLFCLGILGQYLAKTYMETKQRPIFICKDTNIGQNTHNGGE